jgi:hypothetical protein
MWPYNKKGGFQVKKMMMVFIAVLFGFFLFAPSPVECAGNLKLVRELKGDWIRKIWNFKIGGDFVVSAMALPDGVGKIEVRNFRTNKVIFLGGDIRVEDQFDVSDNGRFVVWTDKRNSEPYWPTSSDIYAFDTLTREEISVTRSPKWQFAMMPTVSDDGTTVWIDGLGNNIYAIHSRNILTGEGAYFDSFFSLSQLPKIEVRFGRVMILYDWNQDGNWAPDSFIKVFGIDGAYIDDFSSCLGRYFYDAAIFSESEVVALAKDGLSDHRPFSVYRRNVNIQETKVVPMSGWANDIHVTNKSVVVEMFSGDEHRTKLLFLPVRTRVHFFHPRSERALVATNGNRVAIRTTTLRIYKEY